MSSGLAVQMSSAAGGGGGDCQYQPVNFTSARPKLLHLVPTFYPPRVAHISPHSAPVQQQPNTPVRQFDALWMCQECDQRPAILAGCYCLECVREYRQCMHCGVSESAHHRENRLRRRTAIMRTSYVCISCVHQQMCWNRTVGSNASTSQPQPQPQPQQQFNHPMQMSS